MAKKAKAKDRRVTPRVGDPKKSLREGGTGSLPRRESARGRRKGIGFKQANTGDRAPRPDEIVDMVKLNRNYQTVRLIGDVWPYMKHWITIHNKEGAAVNIPKTALNFDPSTDTVDETIEDPYLDIPNERRTSKQYYVNCIVRSLQENEPAKPQAPSKAEKVSGFKEPNSRSWTPVRVLRIPSSVAKELQKIITMNIHVVDGEAREFELSDPKYGRDIFISYDSKAAPMDKYSIQQGDHTPLSKKERAYLAWDISDLEKPESLEEAKREAASLTAKAVDAVHEEDEDEEDERDILKEVLDAHEEKERRKKPKPGRKKPGKRENVEVSRTRTKPNTRRR